jgi:hypothetical protein
LESEPEPEPEPSKLPSSPPPSSTGASTPLSRSPTKILILRCNPSWSSATDHWILGPRDEWPPFEASRKHRGTSSLTKWLRQHLVEEHAQLPRTAAPAPPQACRAGAAARVSITAIVAVFKFNKTRPVNRPYRAVSREGRFHRYG